MTSMASQSTTLQNNPGSPAPYSGLVRIGAGVALILAGLLNGLPPYLFSVFVGDMTFSEQIKWGATHMAAQRAEQLAVVVSTLFMPLGLLGVAQVTRWRAPRLTLFAVPFMLWGMWGFHNILSSGYVAATIAPAKLGVEQAVALNDAFLADGGLVAAALLPHLVGSFLGVLLLTVAAWRSKLFSAVPCGIVIVFLVWDFLLPSAGLLEPHSLLTVGWVWMGLTLVRMPGSVWRGAH